MQFWLSHKPAHCSREAFRRCRVRYYSRAAVIDLLRKTADRGGNYRQARCKRDRDDARLTSFDARYHSNVIPRHDRCHFLWLDPPIHDLGTQYVKPTSHTVQWSLSKDPNLERNIVPR